MHNAIEPREEEKDIELVGAGAQQLALSEYGVLNDSMNDVQDASLRDPLLDSAFGEVTGNSISILPDFSLLKNAKQDDSMNVLVFDEDVNALEDLDDNYGSVENTDDDDMISANNVSMPYSMASRFGQDRPELAGKKHKMNNFKTFFAVIKAYCAINVLMLPMQFANGGYLLSPIMLIVACFFECLCAIKLSEIAIKYNMFSYP